MPKFKFEVNPPWRNNDSPRGSIPRFRPVWGNPFYIGILKLLSSVQQAFLLFDNKMQLLILLFYLIAAGRSLREGTRLFPEGVTQPTPLNNL
jgi:hypothetical protein